MGGWLAGTQSSHINQRVNNKPNTPKQQRIRFDTFYPVEKNSQDLKSNLKYYDIKALTK